MNRIERLLRREIGLDAASIGSSVIQRTVRLRMKHLGLKQPQEYERLLERSSAALAELIEAVVVAETWFFRDREPFHAFVQFAREWLDQNPAGTLRSLSVPCSSGEEPYSLAMALLDARVAAHRFVIDAVDISAHALARARQGLYGRNSFRGKDLDFRDRHFARTKEGYALRPEVRHCVRFYQANLLGEDFLTGQPPYEVIFCRNLLIYFDRATQRQALQKLDRLLSPRGVLFVGPAELPLATDAGFVNANLPLAFALRRGDDQTSGSRQPPPRRAAGAAKPAPSPTSWMPPALDVMQPETVTGRQSSARRTSEPPSELDAARQLADAGRLAEAQAVCEIHLRKHGASAEAYYLLGLIRDATGDGDAVDCYRKALYLDPNHHETLLQMSLLLEKAGDAAGARTFRRRAERAQPKS